ncbi:hypothetical protein Cadr_000031174 [Camelus dromedarius]|uniref:Uncharacterized protein n=1 Tax=Camelus dromedarius TaxID=9838 RepID=A0A5N4BX53_CAMDR|nr:hypothetical protein Cadr_000031174 [Camelus dromedarius]
MGPSPASPAGDSSGFHARPGSGSPCKACGMRPHPFSPAAADSWCPCKVLQFHPTLYHLQEQAQTVPAGLMEYDPSLILLQKQAQGAGLGSPFRAGEIKRQRFSLQALWNETQCWGLLQEHAQGLYAGLVELDLANGLPAVLLELVQFLGVLKVQALTSCGSPEGTVSGFPCRAGGWDIVLGLLEEQALGHFGAYSRGLPAGLVELDTAHGLPAGLSTGLVELAPGLGLLHVKAQVSLQGLWNVTGFLFPAAGFLPAGMVESDPVLGLLQKQAPGLPAGLLEHDPITCSASGIGTGSPCKDSVIGPSSGVTTGLMECDLALWFLQCRFCVSLQGWFNGTHSWVSCRRLMECDPSLGHLPEQIWTLPSGWRNWACSCISCRNRPWKVSRICPIPWSKAQGIPARLVEWDLVLCLLQAGSSPMGAGEGFPAELVEFIPVLGLLQLQTQCLPAGFVEYDLAVGILQEQAQCFHLVLALLQEEAGILPGKADGIGLGCLVTAELVNVTQLLFFCRSWLMFSCVRLGLPQEQVCSLTTGLVLCDPLCFLQMQSQCLTAGLVEWDEVLGFLEISLQAVGLTSVYHLQDLLCSPSKAGGFGPFLARLVELDPLQGLSAGLMEWDPVLGLLQELAQSLPAGLVKLDPFLSLLQEEALHLPGGMSPYKASGIGTLRDPLHEGLGPSYTAWECDSALSLLQ